MGLSENRVYSQWNSHLIGIMISKTIGFRGTLFSDTPIWILLIPRHLETSREASRETSPKFRLQKRGKNILGLCAVINFICMVANLLIWIWSWSNLPASFTKFTFLLPENSQYLGLLAKLGQFIHWLTIPYEYLWNIHRLVWPAPRYGHRIRQHAPGGSSWLMICNCMYLLCICMFRCT